jgi:hypothetical protein
LHQLRRRSLRYERASFVSRAESNINDPITARHDTHIMLYDKHGVARVQNGLSHARFLVTLLKEEFGEITPLETITKERMEQLYRLLRHLHILTMDMKSHPLEQRLASYNLCTTKMPVSYRSKMINPSEGEAISAKT